MAGDFTKLIEVMKKAANGANEASYPMAALFGVVRSVNPLKISVEQKITLDEAQLVLTRNVTDYDLDLTAAHITEPETEHIHAVQDTYTGGGASLPTAHSHGFAGVKKFRVNNALKAGETVLLLRARGGQKFIVIDRLEGSEDDSGGEWLS